MSAAIQLISSATLHPERIIAEVEQLSSGSTEQKLRRALDCIQELQSEIRTLHAELARTERALTQRDTLLRNAVLREQELRAELVKGVF